MFKFKMGFKIVLSRRILALVLLTVFLIIVEGSVIYWTSIATEPYERIAAHAISLVILMTGVIAFYKVTTKMS